MTSFSLQKELHAAGGNITLDVQCEIEDGSFVSLYGPSGAGKTSLLRMLAGFLKPDKGLLKVRDELWYDSLRKIDKPPQHRQAGFVFQDYALFPNMNVEENLFFALNKGDSRNIIDELLEMTGLTGLRKKRIQMLSGGQQQRVALARALARRPKLLLLDEPLSAIDHEMRGRLQETLLNIHSHFDITTIIVSHDIGEIVRLTSRTIHLNNGVVQQFGAPAEVFSPMISDPSSLKGRFLALEKKDQLGILLMLSGNQLIKVLCDFEKAKDLVKGDEIEVTFKNAISSFQKL